MYSFMSGFSQHNYFEGDPGCSNISFAFIIEQYSFERTQGYDFLSIHMMMSIWVFMVWVVTNEAAMNIHVSVFEWKCAFFPLGQKPRSGMAGSYGRYTFIVF